MTMKQSELEANRCKGDRTQENACEQGALGFGFTCDWLRKQHEFFLTNQRAKYSKTKANANYFRNRSLKERKQRRPRLPGNLVDYFKFANDKLPAFVC